MGSLWGDMFKCLWTAATSAVVDSSGLQVFIYGRQREEVSTNNQCYIVASVHEGRSFGEHLFRKPFIQALMMRFYRRTDGKEKCLLKCHYVLYGNWLYPSHPGPFGGWGGLESQEAICKGKAIPSYDEIPVAFQPTSLYQMLQSPQMVVLSRVEQLLDGSTAFL